MARPQIYAIPRRLLTTILLVFVSLLIGVGASMFYTNYVDRNSNQAWCDIINGLHDRYDALPVGSSPEAEQFARHIAILKDRYDC